MRYNSFILIILAGALLEHMPSACGQWLRVPHPASSGSGLLSSKISPGGEVSKDKSFSQTTIPPTIATQEQKQEEAEGEVGEYEDEDDEGDEEDDDDEDEGTIPPDAEHTKINPSSGGSPDNPPSPSNNSEKNTTVPITATLFSGSPGPKACRGSTILRIALDTASAATTATCYNIPSSRATGVGIAQCGNFVANKDDGCQARVFAEPDCRVFVNVAVFTPEKADFGGFMRSVEITCGVESEMPPPLKLPGLQLPAGAMQAAG